MLSILVRLEPVTEHDPCDVILPLEAVEVAAIRRAHAALADCNGITMELPFEGALSDTDLSAEELEELQDLDAPVRGSQAARPPMRLAGWNHRRRRSTFDEESLFVDRDGSVWLAACEAGDEGFEGEGYVGSVAELVAEAGV